MCLITNKKSKIAENDIIVYKAVRRSLQPNEYEPAYYLFSEQKYKLGERYDTEIAESNDWTPFDSQSVKELELIDRMWEVGDEIKGFKNFGEGFHCGLKLDRFSTYGEKVIIECIIPKGATYYTDLGDLAITSSIIFVKEIKRNYFN